MTDKRGFSTRAIHYGYDPTTAYGALTPPIHLTSTFGYQRTEDLRAVFAGESDGYAYSRVANPTNDLLQRRLAELEGGEAAIVTASGMGAITALFWSLVRPGDEVVTDKTLYGCTFAFLTQGLAEFGVKITPA